MRAAAWPWPSHKGHCSRSPGAWLLASTTITQVHVGFRLRWGNKAGHREACRESAPCSMLPPGSGVLAAPRGRRGHIPAHPRLTGYMVGAGTWPSDSWHSFPLPSTSPCSPKAETLLCPGLEARTREKTQNRSKTGSEAAMPGEPWGSAIERGGWPERGKSKKTQPQPPATWLPRLPAPPHSPTSL